MMIEAIFYATIYKSGYQRENFPLTDYTCINFKVHQISVKSNNIVKICKLSVFYI